MKIKKGEEVVLRHTVEYDKAGNPRITGARSRTSTTVDAVYMDGRVRVKSGDVWDVIRGDDGKLYTGLV